MGMLVITWNFPPKSGGMEELLGNLCTGLNKKHPLFVITSYAHDTRRFEPPVFRPKWRGLIPFFVYALWKSVWLLSRTPELTVVLGGSALVSPLVLITARLFRRKAVLQVHGLDLLYPSSFYQFLVVRWVKYCDRIIANSRFTASLATRKGVREQAIAIIPPGVDPQRFAARADVAAAKSELGLERRKIVLFVGRLAKRKGVKEFIERSLASIVQEIPEVCFVIAGDNPVESLTHRDDVLSDIKAAIVQLRLQDHVRLLGAVSDEQVVALYQIADVVVLPALASKEDVEGFGIVLLEAAAAATPTVATRVGGIPDAIEDGKSGVLVEPGDYNGMGESIIELLRNDALRSALGDCGSRRVRENFGWERIAENYEQVLGLAAPDNRSG